MFIAQVLVGPSKQLKQIIQIEHNIAKNPNWPEANQLVIYKRDRGFELGITDKQIQIVARAGLEPGTAGFRVRHADHSVRDNGLFFSVTEQLFFWIVLVFSLEVAGIILGYIYHFKVNFEPYWVISKGLF